MEFSKFDLIIVLFVLLFSFASSATYNYAKFPSDTAAPPQQLPEGNLEEPVTSLDPDSERTGGGGGGGSGGGTYSGTGSGPYSGSGPGTYAAGGSPGGNGGDQTSYTFNDNDKYAGVHHCSYCGVDQD